MTEASYTPTTLLSPTQCRMARVALSWTVRQLAEAAGIAPNTVQRFEAGNGANLRTARALARALEAQGVELLPGEKPGVRVPRQERDG